MAADLIPETVTVARDDLIDLVAALHATQDVFCVLNGADHPAGEYFGSEAWRLKVATLGGGPTETGGDEWETEPAVVEIYARSSVMEAEALSRCAFEGRISTLRAMADRYRVKGTVEVPFELVESREEVTA